MKPPYVTEKRLRYLRERGIVEAIRQADGALPQSANGTEDPDAIERRLHCRRQFRCLSVAESRMWQALSCAACTVEDAMGPEELRDDMHGLAAMLAEARIGLVDRTRDEEKKP